MNNKTGWLILIAIMAYTLPWLVNPGIGLTFGAYDLAEWASLHPEVRDDGLLTALLLRIPLLCLTILAAFNSAVVFSVRWFLGFVLVGLLVITALPPFEFLTESRNDPNYQQQFILTMVAGFGAVIGLSGLLRRFKPIISIIIAIIGIIAGGIGLLNAHDLMVGFSMPIALGWGVFGLVVALLGVIWLNVMDVISRYQRGSTVA